jgi:WD40 repeat protein
MSDCNFQCVFTLKKHTAVVDGLAISPDGKILASCGREDFIYLWNLETGEAIKTIAEEDDIYTNRSILAFSLDGKIIISGGFGRYIDFWDTATGLLSHEVREFPGYFVLSKDQKKAICWDRHNLGIVDLTTNSLLCEIKHDEYISSDVLISPDSTFFVTSYDTGAIKIWDLAGNLQSVLLEGKARYYEYPRLALSPDGRVLAFLTQEDRTQSQQKTKQNIFQNFRQSLFPNSSHKKQSSNSGDQINRVIIIWDFDTQRF